MKTKSSLIWITFLEYIKTKLSVFENEGCCNPILSGRIHLNPVARV